MNASPWLQLQTELRDLAFLLDRRGSHAAADLAATTAARIGELLESEIPVPQIAAPVFAASARRP
ncbi:MAG: hypothetical protein V4773_13210 [Verrucomicrobiota bacterium]